MTKSSATALKAKGSGKTRNRPAPSKASSKGRPAASAGKSKDTETPGKRTKLDLLTDLLRDPGGASISELTKATGWQPHSVRGAISGALKRKGLTVTSEVTEGVRRYRVGAPE